MIRLARIVIIGGAVMGVLPLPLAALISGVWGRDVVLISPASELEVIDNKDSWKKGEPVAKIYGHDNGPARVIFAKKENLIIPDEDKSLTLLKVNKQKSENPLQAQTLWFLAKWLTIGGFAAHFAGLIFRAILRKRAAPPPTPAS